MILFPFIYSGRDNTRVINWFSKELEQMYRVNEGMINAWWRTWSELPSHMMPQYSRLMESQQKTMEVLTQGLQEKKGQDPMKPTNYEPGKLFLN